MQTLDDATRGRRLRSEPSGAIVAMVASPHDPPDATNKRCVPSGAQAGWMAPPPSSARCVSRVRPDPSGRMVQMSVGPSKPADVIGRKNAITSALGLHSGLPGQ